MADNTAKIKYLEDEEGVVWLPVTHERAVLDNEGNTLEVKLGQKQATLVSGQNIKTINGDSILGSGNIEVQTEITVDNVPTAGSNNPVKSGGTYTALQGKQDTLVSGTNIKTINGSPILGSGNIEVQTSIDVDESPTEGSDNPVSSGGVYDAIQSVDASIGTIKGIQSITTAQDGTLTISFTDGNSITIDLNHNHLQYLKYVYLTDESLMPVTPDSTTLYLILEQDA